MPTACQKVISLSAEDGGHRVIPDPAEDEDEDDEQNQRDGDGQEPWSSIGSMALSPSALLGGRTARRPISGRAKLLARRRL